MLRASSVGKICTNRPTFNKEEFIKIESKLEEKVNSKLEQNYNRLYLNEYLETKGLITVAKDFSKQLEKKALAVLDPLPDGAKTYLQEVWLENNANFYDMSLTGDVFQLQKGNLVEEGAISLLGKYYNIDIKKNEVRKTKGFLSGECDIHYGTTIRDNKSPESWKTFRNKSGITNIYYWQLIAYCYLYDAKEAYLDYTLMPTPVELIENLTKYYSPEDLEKFEELENTIQNLPLNHRIKTYKINSNIQTEINFLKSRLDKAEKYYKTLTYEICMKIDNNIINEDKKW